MVASVSGASRGAVQCRAASYLPNDGKSKTAKPAPTMPKILALKANAEDGKKILLPPVLFAIKIRMTDGYNFGP